MFRSEVIGKLTIVVVVFVAFCSCASVPDYPVWPPPITKQVSADLVETFLTASAVLDDDPRLDLHTLDKAGRLIAFEKTSGFIFFRHRTIIDIRLEPISPQGTKIIMNLSAEGYEMGGLARPADWYPSSKVDTFLGEDVLDLVEKELRKRAG